jgi:hypothetical protein
VKQSDVTVAVTVITNPEMGEMNHRTDEDSRKIIELFNTKTRTNPHGTQMAWKILDIYLLYSKIEMHYFSLHHDVFIAA